MRNANRTKGPFLVCLDFKTGAATRYVRQFDMSGAGLGWQLTRLHRGTFDAAIPLSVEAIETFRASGVA